MSFAKAAVAAAMILQLTQPSSAAPWMANASHLIMVDGSGGLHSFYLDCQAAPVAYFVANGNAEGRPATQTDPLLVVASGNDTPRTFAAAYDPTNDKYVITGSAAKALVVMALAQKNLTMKIDIHGVQFLTTEFLPAGLDRITPELAQCLSANSADAGAGADQFASAASDASVVDEAGDGLADTSPITSEGSQGEQAANSDASDAADPAVPQPPQFLEGQWTDNDMGDSVRWATVASGSTNLSLECAGDDHTAELSFDLPLAQVSPLLTGHVSPDAVDSGPTLFLVVRPDVKNGSANTTSFKAMTVSIPFGPGVFSLRVYGQAAVHQIVGIIEKAKTSVALSATKKVGTKVLQLWNETEFGVRDATQAINASLAGCP